MFYNVVGMSGEDLRAAHTSEHIFACALSKIRPGSRALKVELKENINYVYVKCKELTWSDIIKASIITNKIIQEGRDVYIEYFDSIEAAKTKYPSLRAYEERIKPPVRVVVIDGYDYAACIGEHVNNTGECMLFLPLAFRSAKKGRYIIEFLAGFRAIEEALNNISLINTIALILGSNREYLISTISNLIDKYRETLRRYRKLLKEFVDNIPIHEIHGYKIKLFYTEFGDRDIIRQCAGEFVGSGEKKIFISFIKVDDRYIVISASTPECEDKLKQIMNSVFSRYDGKGGGKGSWIMGFVIKGIEAYKFLNENISKFIAN